MTTPMDTQRAGNYAAKICPRGISLGLKRTGRQIGLLGRLGPKTLISSCGRPRFAIASSAGSTVRGAICVHSITSHSACSWLTQGGHASQLEPASHDSTSAEHDIILSKAQGFALGALALSALMAPMIPATVSQTRAPDVSPTGPSTRPFMIEQQTILIL